MKSIVKILLLVLVLISGCNSGYTKKQYLKEFDSFISETEKEYKSYEPERWIEVTRTFKNFADTDYRKFESELTENEKAQVERYKNLFYVFAGKYAANQLAAQSKSYRFYKQVSIIFEELNKKPY